METLKINAMYDLEQTIAKDLFEGATYPWEVLGKISEFIVTLGNILPEDKYELRGENIWVAKNAKVAPTACLNGPLIVDEEAAEVNTVGDAINFIEWKLRNPGKTKRFGLNL